MNKMSFEFIEIKHPERTSYDLLCFDFDFKQITKKFGIIIIEPNIILHGEGGYLPNKQEDIDDLFNPDIFKCIIHENDELKKLFENVFKCTIVNKELWIIYAKLKDDKIETKQTPTA